MTGMSGYSSMATSAIGTIMKAREQNKAGDVAEDTANLNAQNALKIAQYNAAKHETAAGQEKAAAQKVAKETKRQFRLKQSRVLALAAASGGGAMDMDVVNAIAGFEIEGDLASQTALYQGDERARMLTEEGEAGIWDAKTKGNVIKYAGKAKSSAYKNKSIATIMEGASSLAHKYGEFRDGGN